jgi:FAD-linked oxidoreductase
VTTWSNWAGQQTCTPARVERPGSESELSEVVGRAAADGLGVRAFGSGHSFTAACLTDGCLINQTGMGRLIDVDRSSGLVRAEAGIKLHALTPMLHEHGLALENQGDIDVQSLAGALSTSTHGTGAQYSNLSANVVGCRLVTADGTVLDLDGDDLAAARVSVGALGVISELTMQCVPSFRIHRIDEPKPLDDVLARFDELADAHDHFEFFGFPHSDRVLTFTSTRTQDAAKPRSRWKAWVDDELIGNHVFGTAMRLGRLRPKWNPGITRTIARFLSRSEILDDSFRVYAHERRVKFTECEYAIPREHAVAAVQRVVELVRSEPILTGFPIEVRVSRGDEQSFLSTAYGRDTAYIAVHQFVGMPFEHYFRGVEAIMDDYEGRPHWGKRHEQTAAKLAPRYPAWERFQAVRAKLDPDGVFTNDYVARSLGPVDGVRPVSQGGTPEASSVPFAHDVDPAG